MKVKLLNRDDARLYGFIVEGVSIRRLRNSIAQCPGVTMTNHRRFFWSSEDIVVKFNFNAHDFNIRPDPWDSALWVVPSQEDETYPDIRDILTFVEKHFEVGN